MSAQATRKAWVNQELLLNQSRQHSLFRVPVFAPATCALPPAFHLSCVML